MMGKTSGEPCTPSPLSLFFDLIACPWDILWHATSHFSSTCCACEVSHAVQSPGKSYHTAQLPIPSSTPLHCTVDPPQVHVSSLSIFLPPPSIMLGLGCL